MKKTIFKILALTLALLMLLPLTMACKKKEEPQGTESGSVSTTVNEHPVPPQDLGGEEFVFATALWGSYTPLTIIDIQTEQHTGEFVNDAAHDRNLYMKENFNCTVKQNDFDPKEVTTKLQQNAMAGDDAFDFVLFRGREYIAAINGGYLAEMSNFNLNYDNSWWDSNAIDAMTINNKNFGIIGDVTTNHLNAVWMATFNKTLVADNKLEDPYELVKQDKWTFAKMIEMSKKIAALSGNAARDGEAYWGINYTSNTVTGLLTACGVKVVEKNDTTGELSLVIGNYQSDIQDIFKDLFDRFHAGNTFLDPIKAQDNDTKFFDKGKVLFLLTATHTAGALRQSDVEYGIIPYPKLNESMNYRPSTAGQFTTVLGIPLSNQKYDTCSVFLEAYAAQGQKRVRTQFYENVLLRKVGRDSESFDMLQYIFENITYDTGISYNLLKGKVDAAAKNEDTDVASFITTNTSVWNSELTKLIEAYANKEPVAQ